MEAEAEDSVGLLAVMEETAAWYVIRPYRMCMRMVCTLGMVCNLPHTVQIHTAHFRTGIHN